MNTGCNPAIYIYIEPTSAGSSDELLRIPLICAENTRDSTVPDPEYNGFVPDIQRREENIQ